MQWGANSMAQIVFGIDPDLPFNKRNIETALKMQGVHWAEADPGTHEVAVEFDPALVKELDLQWAIQGIGFRPYVLGESNDRGSGDF